MLTYGIHLLIIVIMMACNNTSNIEQQNTTTNTEKDDRSLPISQTKFQQGVDFYATGPDSSWTLELDFEKDFKFKRADGFVFNTPAVEGIKAQDANVVRYRAVVESGEMIIQLYKQECIDGSTGKKFPYKVSVEIKRGTDLNYTRVEGCGRFTFDERIHDIWVLQQLNGKTVTGSDLPYIEFNTTEGTVMGKTGCNNFTGKADFKGNKLTLGPLAVTRKFCANAAYESDFLKVLQPGEMEYTVDNGKLSLSRNGKEGIIFKKID